MSTRTERPATDLRLEDLVNLAIERDVEDQPRDYIGASIIAHPCERFLWLTFRWALPASFPPRIRRRFETGDTYEERVARRLRQTGEFRVTTENPRARNEKKQYAAEYGPLGGMLRGHMDGWLFANSHDIWEWLLREEHPLGELPGPDDPVLLETKAIVSSKYEYAEDDVEYDTPLRNKRNKVRDKVRKIEGKWWEIKRRGLAKAFPTHYGQCQAYMGMSRFPDRNGKVQFGKWGLLKPLNWALYIAVNTDTDQWYAELIKRDDRWWSSILARAIRIIRSPHPPERVEENPTIEPCRFCNFREVCHRDEPIDRNCRTCRYAQLKIPGDPKFFGRTATWFCLKHSAGCGDFTACGQHEYIPDPGGMF